MNILGSWNSSQPEENIIAPASGYYGNEYEIGDGAAAYRSVMNRLPNAETRQWFRSCARVIRYQIDQIKNMTTFSQAKVLETPRENVFTHPPQSGL